MKIKKTAIITLFLITIIAHAQQIGEGYAPATIADFSAPLKSGIYNGLNTTTIGMTNDNSNVWQHLFVARHTSTINNYQLQIASSFAVNERLFFRKIASALSSSNTPWIELATRATNTFNGNQIINGNIGVGSISPNAPLDILSNSLAQGIIVRNRAGNDYGNVLFYDNAGSTGLAGIGAASNRIRLMSGGIGDTFERFSITSTGLVGINSLSPLNTFEVKVPTSTGTSSSDGIAVHDGAANRLGINIGINTVGEYSYLQAVKGGIGQKNIAINPIGGNVGIGTTNPTSKLTVAGNIASREVKVTVDAGADFVFENNYNLPSLDAVDKYIKENKHLPEIASADEMKKEGINLSEMNIKLLQKIEEMTLYMIEQNKQIKDLKNENQNFKLISERLSKIEQKLN